jgi:hypothetical protein
MQTYLLGFAHPRLMSGDKMKNRPSHWKIRGVRLHPGHHCERCHLCYRSLTRFVAPGGTLRSRVTQRSFLQRDLKVRRHRVTEGCLSLCGRYPPSVIASGDVRCVSQVISMLAGFRPSPSQVKQIEHHPVPDSNFRHVLVSYR